jgi:hypothetical protein
VSQLMALGFRPTSSGIYYLRVQGREQK